MPDDTPPKPNFPPLPEESQQPPPVPQRPTWLNNSTIGLMVLGMVAVGLWYMVTDHTDRRKIPYEFFKQQLDADNILVVEFKGQVIEGRFKEPPVAPLPLEQENEKGTSKPADAAAVKKPDEIAGKKPDEPAAKKEEAAPEKLPPNFVVTLPPINEKPTL